MLSRRTLHFPRIALSTALAVLFAVHATAQNNLAPESLTVENGLSQGFIYCIAQDREGFLWIGTRNGLNRYDGRTFQVFVHEPLDPYSIAGNVVVSIADKGDYLLVSTLGNTLNLFDKKTKRFYRLQGGDALPKGRFGDLMVDRQDGRVWCRVFQAENRGYILCLKLSDQPVQTEANPWWGLDEVRKWAVDSLDVNSLSQTPDKIWGVAAGALFSLDKNSGTIHKIPTNAPLSGTAATPDGSVWFYGDAGIGRFRNGQWSWWNTDLIKKSSFALSMDQEGGLLLACGGDLYRFDKAVVEAPAQRLDAALGQRLLSLPNKNINPLYVDRSGVLWAGTNGYGLLKYSPRLHRFKTFLKDNSINLPVLIDAQGKAGVALHQGGRIQAIEASGAEGWRLPAGVRGYSRMAVGPGGREWLLARSDEFRLELFCRSGKPAGDWERALSLALGQTGSFLLAAAADNRVRMAAGHQFMVWRPGDPEPKKFDYSAVLPEAHNLFALAQTRGGTWWIGTDRGLLLALPVPDSFSFKLFRTIPGEAQGIQNNFITTLLTDPADSSILWIGTQGGGLSRLDTRTFQFRHYNTRNGFPDNVINGLLADGAGVLWMSSNKGIIRFNPATGAIRNFTVEDGLPTNEFNIRACGKQPDGTLLFGCVDGLVAFHPGDFTGNPVAPQVRITGLELNNRKVAVGDSSGVLPQAIGFARRLELPFSQNSITLHFAALEYTIPAKNGFQYYLKGAEPEWAHNSTNGTASYLNLAPGHYCFRVKACNSDGVWNDIPAELRITILPPWYRTRLACGVYALLLLGLGYGLLRFFLYRQRLHDKLALEQREAERLKELDAFKSRLYTNISHELRTPVTLIMAPVEQLIRHHAGVLDDKARSNLNLVLQNSRKLRTLVEELLDLSRLEASKITLNERPAPLAPLLRQWFDAFRSLAEMKQIDYRFSAMLEDNSRFYIDRDHLEKIVNNLLSNALKFTPKAGKVELTLDQTAAHIRIQVRDSGRGIPEEDLPHVFERYFQTRQNDMPGEGGLGIGLALSRELALLMNGDLRAESRWGVGSVFTLLLPARPAPSDATAQELPAEPLLPQQEAVDLTGTQASAQARLLIVEDTPEMQQFLLGLLQEHYACQCADNGLEAWALLNPVGEAPPEFDLILSDVMMPEMDGYALLEKLKDHPHWQYCPVIMLTARAAEADKLHALRLGVDDYLSKPFSSGELLARVANLVRNHRQRREFLARHPQPPGVPFENTEPADQRWLSEIEAAVKTALDAKRPITALLLADKMALSNRQLLRRLKALTGLSINDYIQEIKLQKARHLLENKSYHTIAEVAYACGFNTPAYFSRVFEKRFGKRPGEV